MINNKIEYPLKDGNTLYIGETGRRKEPTVERFNHIHTNLEQANNYCDNYTLIVYYNKNEKTKLAIYLVKSKSERRMVKRLLVKKH